MSDSEEFIKVELGYSLVPVVNVVHRYDGLRRPPLISRFESRWLAMIYVFSEGDSE